MSRQVHKKVLPYKKIVDLSFHRTRLPSDASSLVRFEQKPAIVNIHGLLGSHVMFHSLNKFLSRKIDADIFSVDVRNHGISPKAIPYDYTTLTNDLIHFIKTHVGLERPIYLLGFSMGGKIALLTTLFKNINVQKCISIDLPPYETPKLDPLILQNYDLIMQIIRRDVQILKGSPNWQKKVLELFKSLDCNKRKCGGAVALYFANGFLSVKSNNVSQEQSHFEQQLDGKESDPYINFLMPLSNMPHLLDEVKKWPDSLNQDDFFSKGAIDRKVLIMRGLQSSFISSHYSLLRDKFPCTDIQEFDTGHTLLLESPEESFKCILNFFCKGKY
ncbi:YGR015C-like protein [Saccharomyces cerevisiae x Saccharomyces kudriavzevii VIN7]|uniref:YGR015C-like protein n=1 Tax=Saccharomyces cerevisiae x Saccharomyces kudriavzevii (strain VIN7) TaxID=1095631 RepID=H0GUZ2_SACCK|nr:YGR015C-like protein [Saccharomyces cerevisiae x Saccharomyces kudriavzevii VIN7]CAI5271862.1 AIS_HP2_G0019120.mRNA.1.CDS.1 [Saccharomyces cerevisiae]CAI6515260.1 AIS_HP2_G0019120.mRNA.1.CDS.1 [Saccharomyces cerevisiae]